MQIRISQLALALLLLISRAPAQTADWRAVERLPPGAPISVRDRHPRINCVFQEATADQLVCEQRIQYRTSDLGRYQVRFNRQSIHEVRLERPVDSALVGAAIGGGGGAALGASTALTNRGVAALLVGGVGALLGAHVGAEASMVHGQIIYKP